MEDSSNRETRIVSTIESFDLVQRVNFPAHRCGHKPDLVITRKCEPQGSIVRIESLDPVLSNHSVVKFKTLLKKRPFKKENPVPEVKVIGL